MKNFFDSILALIVDAKSQLPLAGTFNESADKICAQIREMATAYDKITCPKCDSDEVYSIDNEPICHKQYGDNHLKEMGYQHDSEIYIKFQCKCGECFTETFDITPRVRKPKGALLTPVLKQVNLFVTVTVNEATDVNQLAINTRLAMENSDNVTSVASGIKVETQEQTFK